MNPCYQNGAPIITITVVPEPGPSQSATNYLWSLLSALCHILQWKYIAMNTSFVTICLGNWHHLLCLSCTIHNLNELECHSAFQPWQQGAVNGGVCAKGVSPPPAALELPARASSSSSGSWELQLFTPVCHTNIAICMCQGHAKRKT